MKITTEQTEKLLSGDYKFSQLGFSMLVTRLKMVYAQENTLEVLEDSMNEINTFLGKFKFIMVADYEIISKL